MRIHHHKGGCVLGNHRFGDKRVRHILLYDEGILLQFNKGTSVEKSINTITYGRWFHGLPYSTYVGGLPYYNGIVERAHSGDSCQCSEGYFGGDIRCISAQFDGATK